VEETKRVKLTDKAIFGMVSEGGFLNSLLVTDVLFQYNLCLINMINTI